MNTYFSRSVKGANSHVISPALCKYNSSGVDLEGAQGARAPSILPKICLNYM